MTKLSACQYSGRILSFNMFNIFNIESKKSALSGAKAGTINRIMDYLIDKFHKNNYHYRLANNRSYDFCVCYFTVFTLSIQTPRWMSGKQHRP